VPPRPSVINTMSIVGYSLPLTYPTLYSGLTYT